MQRGNSHRQNEVISPAELQTKKKKHPRKKPIIFFFTKKENIPPPSAPKTNPLI
jgi:hypothetical protein